MLPIRRSPATHPNVHLRRIARATAKTNGAALAHAMEAAGLGVAGDLILLGGSSVADFRIRVAQSHARHDMTPSYWSQAGVLVDATTVATVPLGPLGDPATVPATNAIQHLPIEAFDDAAQFPNLAVLRFPGASEPVAGVVARLLTQRSLIDLPSLVLAWLGFAWGAGGSANPLLAGIGVPSAAFVETAFAIAQVELTPGLASASSCPEAIWQAAKWWHAFYEQASGSASGTGPEPEGMFVIRQPEATYRLPVP